MATRMDPSRFGGVRVESGMSLLFRLFEIHWKQISFIIFIIDNSLGLLVILVLSIKRVGIEDWNYVFDNLSPHIFQASPPIFLFL